MGFSKAKRVFFLGMALAILLSVSGLAAGDDKGPLETALGKIYEIFGFLPKVLTPELLQGGDEQAVFFAKFLIFLLLFSVLYFLSGAVFGESKGVRFTVPFVISLMGTVLIPGAVLKNIFQTYTVVVAIIIWLVPVLGVFAINHFLREKMGDTRARHMASFLVYSFAIWVMYQMDQSIPLLLGPGESVARPWRAATQIHDYFGLIFAFLYILTIYHAFKFIVGGGESGFKVVGEGSWASQKESPSWWPFGGPRKDRESEAAEKERRELIESEKEAEQSLRLDTEEERITSESINKLVQMKKEVASILQLIVHNRVITREIQERIKQLSVTEDDFEREIKSIEAIERVLLRLESHDAQKLVDAYAVGKVAKDHHLNQIENLIRGHEKNITTFRKMFDDAETQLGEYGGALKTHLDKAKRTSESGQLRQELYLIDTELPHLIGVLRNILLLEQYNLRVENYIKSQILNILGK
ncbi:hypothetical protein HY638_03365 [Candidatus Woesearchaeota archaeon]|nr:hypothetical protein [Candidatus Woesearchaeota archaeon]